MVKVSKEQRKYLEKVCTCGHSRCKHNGVTGDCYVSGCKCISFRESKQGYLVV